MKTRTVAGLALAFLSVVMASAILKWVQDGERIAHASRLGWYELSREPARVLPEPSQHRDLAVVKVLAAPTYGWRGYFAVHPWIVYKRAGDDRYTRHEVIGWGRRDVVRRNHAAPDGLWYGAAPEVLVSHTGPAAQALIPAIESAIASYPYRQVYRSYPGPNSNTFLAHIGREVPGLGLDLPPTAIGKDWRAWSSPVGKPPSGQGVQVSLAGLLGAIISWQEGFEINVLGLNMGIDLNCPAFRLPFVGRLGMNGSTAQKACGLS